MRRRVGGGGEEEEKKKLGGIKSCRLQSYRAFVRMCGA